MKTNDKSTYTVKGKWITGFDFEVTIIGDEDDAREAIESLLISGNLENLGVTKDIDIKKVESAEPKF